MSDDAIVMLGFIPAAVVFFLALLAGLRVVARDTIRRRGNFGLNLKKVSCPCCGDPFPMMHVPKNWRQAMWGGCNCANCGLEYDKWGRAVDDNELQRRLDEFDDNPYARNRPWQAEPDDRL